MMFVKSSNDTRTVNVAHIVCTEVKLNPKSSGKYSGKDDQYVLIAHMDNGMDVPIAYGSEPIVLYERQSDLLNHFVIPNGCVCEYGEICDETPF